MMVQQSLQSRSQRRSGFALFVVLSSLLIITLLFSMSMSRSLASASLAQAEVEVSERLQNNVLLLKQASNNRGSDGFAAIDEQLLARPVNGLIDLNTATPRLMQRFLQGFDLPPDLQEEVLQRHIEWRGEGNRYVTELQFLNVTGMPRANLTSLRMLGTVHSGRSTLDPEQIPMALLQHLTDQADGSQSDLVQMLPAEWFAKSNTTISSVYFGQKRIGVVDAGSYALQRGVIWIDLP